MEPTSNQDSGRSYFPCLQFGFSLSGFDGIEPVDIAHRNTRVEKAREITCQSIGERNIFAQKPLRWSYSNSLLSESILVGGNAQVLSIRFASPRPALQAGLAGPNNSCYAGF